MKRALEWVPVVGEAPIWRIATPNDAAKSEGDYSVVLRRGQFELWVTCIERDDVIRLAAQICGLLNQVSTPQEPSNCPNCDMPLGTDGGCHYPECNKPQEPSAVNRAAEAEVARRELERARAAAATVRQREAVG